MKAPHTYSEWVIVLDAFANKTDDDNIIPLMHAGSLDWQPGVADRFSQRLADAVNTRMNAAVDSFQKKQSHFGSDEKSTVMSMRSLRKEFVRLIDAMDIPAVPEKYRTKYRLLVKQQADAVQKSIEDSARGDRSGKLLSIVRKTPVNKF